MGSNLVDSQSYFWLTFVDTLLVLASGDATEADFFASPTPHTMLDSESEPTFLSGGEAPELEGMGMGLLGLLGNATALLGLLPAAGLMGVSRLPLLLVTWSVLFTSWFSADREHHTMLSGWIFFFIWQWLEKT